MGSASNKSSIRITLSKNPPPPPTTSSDTEDKNPNSLHLNNNNNNLNSSLMDSESIPPLTIEGSEEDSMLRNSKFLIREEVIRRRLRRTKQLERFYKDHYWALMEEIRVQYRQYYWKYGKSPFQEEEDTIVDKPINNGEASDDNTNTHRLGFGLNATSIDGTIKRCLYSGCKSKAMPFTNYCHPHILSDTKQKLYKACNYIIKSAQNGPVHCGKPILRATVPSLCTIHFQKAQTHVTRALKKAGLTISSPSKLAPKFHVLVTESIHQINTRRRERRLNISSGVVKVENAG